MCCARRRREARRDWPSARHRDARDFDGRLRMTRGGRRIAIYGGTFDPVHVGHAAVARSLLQVFGLDEHIFVPAVVAPHKRERKVSPAFDRHAMLALATQGEESLRVSTLVS